MKAWTCLLTLIIPQVYSYIHSLSGHLLYNKLLVKFPTISDILFQRLVNTFYRHTSSAAKCLCKEDLEML